MCNNPSLMNICLSPNRDNRFVHLIPWFERNFADMFYIGLIEVLRAVQTQGQ